LTNGIMDRVHLWREGGRATKAIIYDFKTDALDPTRSAEEQLLERYAPQLDLYREALSQLEGMPIAAVSGRLVPV
jgi:ATP-dependent exoDNAse (exonuclease V) beta subunit